MDYNQRIYYKCRVLTPEPIIELQKSLTACYKFKSVNPDKLHLTIFHYGKPLELHSEIMKWSGHLSFNDFLNKFCRSLKNNVQIQGLKFKVQAGAVESEIATGDSLDEFGDAEVLVLRVTLPKRLLDIRSTILSSCKQLLYSCAISDADAFVETSENLKWQIKYQPHLTIGLFDVGHGKVHREIEETLLKIGNVELVS